MQFLNIIFWWLPCWTTKFVSLRVNQDSHGKIFLFPSKYHEKWWMFRDFPCQPYRSRFSPLFYPRCRSRALEIPQAPCTAPNNVAQIFHRHWQRLGTEGIPDFKGKAQRKIPCLIHRCTCRKKWTLIYNVLDYRYCKTIVYIFAMYDLFVLHIVSCI